MSHFFLAKHIVRERIPNNRITKQLILCLAFLSIPIFSQTNVFYEDEHSLLSGGNEQHFEIGYRFPESHFSEQLLVAQLPTAFNGTAVDDSKLLDEFVQTKIQSNAIVFDAANIKQFWVDNSVLSQDNTIIISLTDSRCIPLKIQLINVNEYQDCKIDVITEDPDLSFCVLNNEGKTLSKATNEDTFIHYSIVSSSFHLEDASDSTFNISFSKQESNVVRIKKIILTFSQNKRSFFLSSPGTLKITKNDLELIRTTAKQSDNEKAFYLTGIENNSIVRSRYKILVTDNTFHISVKVKNAGNCDIRTTASLGVYNKKHIWLNYQNYPYKDINHVLTVISSEKDSSKLIVDSYPEWRKGGCIALDAKEDFSDIPNTNLLAGRISEVKELENGYAEITLNKPLDESINGRKVRVNSFGESYLPLKTTVLKPGEEKILEAEIRKDDNFHKYSEEALSSGVYYIAPVIHMQSVDQNKESSVFVSDFELTY